MIDKSNREKLSEALRHLLSGQITNFTFDERSCFGSSDRAVREIADAVWGLYDDLRDHRLRDSDAPSPDLKEMVTQGVRRNSGVIEEAQWKALRFERPQLMTRRR